ncbi:1,4-alpha-glucan branching protein GlgB [Solimonas sp. SE-A11]|uniref:1,4-alpha-glucan branching protein GlgB n=1 Tax=Solimonas sp. SE-A11 TaxID=3054954 RepID=UPI00259CAD86|nr:1,4-alpha-glucan branching protein GlgB [Solimonas sp. SE-A11]MDM4772222.1 1,4-alpha-glucan branching protein GlgB [Solimonas sp. SE-A11]
MRARDSSLFLPAEQAQALAEGRLGDPFAALGPHEDGNNVVLRCFLPGAEEVAAVDESGVLAVLKPLQVPGLFAGRIPPAHRYRLRIHWPGGGVQETEDPYAFGLLLGELDLHLIGEGRHYRLGSCLGAQHAIVGGVPGIRFAVWAPNAQRVSVIGDFNHWDGRRHPMRLRRGSGIWELFLPRLATGSLYKYELLDALGQVVQKADPVALQTERPPQTASIVAAERPYDWTDDAWMAGREACQSPQAPIAVYELHASSWRKGETPDWDALAERLIPYVQDLGFTHIELLPITAHPFGGSWGYQPLGMFAPQADMGEPEALKRFIDRAHSAGLGVLADWVPAHFPSDPHGLARFDGTALYEHEDPREGYHQDWNTLIYNFGRREVQGFLIASALHWLQEFHLDGLRVDAVASMLYRDYSRKPGEWVPNRYGGRENLEAVEFLRHLNEVVAARCPGAIVVAEESTAWPGVTHAIQDGGLGFSYKWNMGWMHDTLQYIQRDPLHRAHHHDGIGFGLVYAFSERFMLPLSHDEVVHGKGSMIGKMPGDRWQQFANLRAYYGFMWSHPGKKLLFMGGELAQPREWNHDASLDWALLEDPLHRGVHDLLRDLNRIYREQPALHECDCEGSGFHWIVSDDRQNSVFAWYRAGHLAAPPVIAISNFTPVPRHGYRLGAPRAGRWREILNSDAAIYGGSGVGSGGECQADPQPSHGQPYSLTLTLPPLATLLLAWEPQEASPHV